MEFNYDFLNDIFQDVWDGTGFAPIVYGLKGIAIAFLLVRLVYTLSKTTLKKKTFDNLQKVEIPISLWHILTYTFYAVMIASYDLLLAAADNILGYFVFIYTDLDVTSVSLALDEMDYEGNLDAEETWYQVFKRFGYTALAYLNNPTLIVVKIVKVIAWILDLIIYAIFIGQRFFVLMILKLLGPLALCLSLLPGFEGTIGRWLTLYARWFLLIIPYFLANICVAAFVETYEDIFVGFGRGYSGGYIDDVKAMVEVPLILLIVILKPILYAAGKQLFNYLIDYKPDTSNE